MYACIYMCAYTCLCVYIYVCICIYFAVAREIICEHHRVWNFTSDHIYMYIYIVVEREIIANAHTNCCSVLQCIQHTFLHCDEVY